MNWSQISKEIPSSLVIMSHREWNGGKGGREKKNGGSQSSVTRAMLHCRSLASSLVKAKVNWGPQSDMTFLCSPNCLKIWLKKSWAIPMVSTALVQGARITPLLTYY